MAKRAKKRPLVAQADCTLGVVVSREMTDEEYKQYRLDQKEAKQAGLSVRPPDSLAQLAQAITEAKTPEEGFAAMRSWAEERISA